jgi:hypothetical protein
MPTSASPTSSPSSRRRETGLSRSLLQDEETARSVPASRPVVEWSGHAPARRETVLGWGECRTRHRHVQQINCKACRPLKNFSRVKVAVHQANESGCARNEQETVRVLPFIMRADEKCPPYGGLFCSRPRERLLSSARPSQKRARPGYCNGSTITSVSTRAAVSSLVAGLGPRPSAKARSSKRCPCNQPGRA